MYSNSIESFVYVRSLKNKNPIWRVVALTADSAAPYDGVRRFVPMPFAKRYVRLLREFYLLESTGADVLLRNCLLEQKTLMPSQCKRTPGRCACILLTDILTCENYANKTIAMDI